MKKKMIALLAGALFMLGASNAMAAYGNLEIMEVFVNSATSQEYVVDLGSLSYSAATGLDLKSINASLLTTTAAAAGFTLGAGTTVSFYGVDIAHSSAIVGANVAPVSNYSGFSSYLGAVNIIATHSGTSYQGSTTSTIGFDYLMLGNDGTGAAFNSFVDNSATGDNTPYALNLASLAAVNLGIYSLADNGHTGVLQLSGAVTLNGDGTVTTTLTDVIPPAAATPIPAAAYLLGSGLMGLFGLRRKQRG